MQNQSSSRINLYYRHYNLPLEFPTAAFLGDHWILSDHPVNSMHFHNCMEIGYCYSGYGTIFVEQKKISFQEGDICIIPENTVHISYSEEGVTSRWEYILFDPRLLFPREPFSHLSEHNRFLYDEPGLSNLISRGKYPELTAIVRHILEEFHQLRLHYQDSLRGLFLAFISQYLSCRPALNTDSPEQMMKRLTIWPAIQHVRLHYNEKITVPQLSALCSLSEPHFRRVFGAVIHMTPLDYLHQLRIRQACYLLTHSNIPVNEIAQKTGFVTLSSFNRQFQMIVGTSPSLWKTKNKDAVPQHQILSLQADETKSIFQTLKGT